MLVDDETNNSTGAEMQNQHKTEKGDDANKIKSGIRLTTLIYQISSCCKKQANVKISSRISSLNSYLDENGIIRVRGRLKKSDINNDCKHPILLSKLFHISILIILWCHQKTGHFGRGMSLNEVRSSGFWIINANSVKHSLIYHCVTCRNLRGKLGEQVMSQLTSGRLQESHITVLTCLVLLLSKVKGKN